MIDLVVVEIAGAIVCKDCTDIHMKTIVSCSCLRVFVKTSAKSQKFARKRAICIIAENLHI